MAKRSKEKVKVKKTSKANKNIEKNTKDEKINFDEEVFIGLKRIDEDKHKTGKKKSNNEKNKKNKNAKVKNKEKNLKTVNKENEQEENTIILENIEIIGTKQNTKQNREDKKTKKQNKSKVSQNSNNQGQIKKNTKQKKQKKLTPQQQLAKKKRQAIFRIVKFITLIGIIIAGIIYALLSPIFNIKTISVIGNSQISVDEIISLSGLQLEQNMFKYRTEDVIQKIKENAYINTVKVTRKIPDTIEILVSEREASFMIQFANAYAYINNQGYILEISDKKQELPIITGIETEQENIQVGSRLCTEDLKKLGDVLKIVESSISNNIYDLITKIDVTNQSDYILTLQEKKKVVYLGDTSNLSTKMLWILKFNEIEEDTEGEIILNMNLNDENNKPYFRKKV